MREDLLGGHAFAIVGYNSKGFLIQNSWGRDWGSNGVALWRYEDWQENIRDAWVFRMALATPQIWHNPPNQYSSKLDDRERLGRSPNRAEIAGHFVHIDDGHFHETGRYWSTESDTRQTAKLIARSKKYNHILLYAHGGLNSPRASAARIGAMRDIFKQNGIYPYHIMYDTGLLEELKDVVLGKQRETEARAGGFTDWVDRLIEHATRVPGRALWREMKAGACSPFETGMAGSAVIRAFIDAFKAARRKPSIHLAGHSTGAILMAHLAVALGRIAPQLRIKSCHLMAPAATVDLYRTSYLPLLLAREGFGIDRMTTYNLDEQLEQDDNVAQVYRKSLLYLVSQAFEEQPPESILGMQVFNEGLTEQSGGALEFVYSHHKDDPESRTRARSHGGFDNDPATLNDIMRNILGKEPQRLFVADDLSY